MIEVETGVGRVVWGNPAKSQVKKNQQKQVVMKDGVPVNQWAFGVAYPKAEFQAKVWPAMLQEATSAFGQNIPPKFSWKYKDGDGVDPEGKPYSLREGYAGCIILTISTEAFAPPIFRYTNGQFVQVQPHEIKCGDYVTVKLNIKVNVPTDRTFTPGLYINPQGVLLVGYGTEIQNSADPASMFGAAPQYQLPAGASATPIAPNTGHAMPGSMPGQMQQQPHNPAMITSGPAGMPHGGYAPQPGQMQQQPGYPPQQPQMMPGQPMAPQSGQMPGYAPQPGMMQPQQPGYPPQVQPAHDFVQNAGMQQQPGYQPQPMAPQPGQMPGYAPQPGMMPGMLPNR